MKSTWRDRESEKWGGGREKYGERAMVCVRERERSEKLQRLLKGKHGGEREGGMEGCCERRGQCPCRLDRLNALTGTDGVLEWVGFHDRGTTRPDPPHLPPLGRGLFLSRCVMPSPGWWASKTVNPHRTSAVPFPICPLARSLAPHLHDARLCVFSLSVV